MARKKLKSSRNAVVSLFDLKTFTAVVLMCALVACTAKVNKPTADHGMPSWVLNTPYEQGFLYGVGSAEVFGGDLAGATRRAKDIARVELVKQIEVNVHGVVEQEISETLQAGVTELTQKLRQVIKNQVPKFKLSHVESMDHYQSQGRVTVLVRFSVTQELQALRRQIVSIDDELLQYAEEINEGSNFGMSALRRISPAFILIDQRAGLQARYNKLDPKRSAVPLLSDEVKSLVNDLYEQISNIRISVEPKGAFDPSLQMSLVSQLSKKSMHILPSDAQVDIQVLYEFQTNTVNREGVSFVMTKGHLWINDENGNVVRATQAKAKGVSTDPVEAQTRSMDKLSNVLGNELLKALF